MANALIIVDMQKRWIRTDKAMYPSVTQAIDNIQKLRVYFEQRGDPIFHAYISHNENGTDRRSGEKLFNVAGSVDAEIINELSPKETDILIAKTRLSAFFGTNLLNELRTRGIKGIAVTGLELRACVMATYIDAYQHDFRPVSIISDAVLDGNEAYIKNFITTFSGKDFFMSSAKWMGN